MSTISILSNSIAQAFSKFRQYNSIPFEHAMAWYNSKQNKLKLVLIAEAGEFMISIHLETSESAYALKEFVSGCLKEANISCPREDLDSLFNPHTEDVIQVEFYP